MRILFYVLSFFLLLAALYALILGTDNSLIFAFPSTVYFIGLLSWSVGDRWRMSNKGPGSNFIVLCGASVLFFSIGWFAPATHPEMTQATLTIALLASGVGFFMYKIQLREKKQEEEE